MSVTQLSALEVSLLAQYHDFISKCLHLEPRSLTVNHVLEFLREISSCHGLYDSVLGLIRPWHSLFHMPGADLGKLVYPNENPRIADRVFSEESVNRMRLDIADALSEYNKTRGAAAVRAELIEITDAYGYEKKPARQGLVIFRTVATMSGAFASANLMVWDADAKKIVFTGLPVPNLIRTFKEFLDCRTDPDGAQTPASVKIFPHAGGFYVVIFMYRGKVYQISGAKFGLVQNLGGNNKTVSDEVTSALLRDPKEGEFHVFRFATNEATSFGQGSWLEPFGVFDSKSRLVEADAILNRGPLKEISPERAMFELLPKKTEQLSPLAGKAGNVTLVSYDKDGKIVACSWLLSFWGWSAYYALSCDTTFMLRYFILGNFISRNRQNVLDSPLGLLTDQQSPPEEMASHIIAAVSGTSFAFGNSVGSALAAFQGFMQSDYAIDIKHLLATKNVTFGTLAENLDRVLGAKSIMEFDPVDAYRLYKQIFLVNTIIDIASVTSSYKSDLDSIVTALRADSNFKIRISLVTSEGIGYLRKLGKGGSRF